MTVITRNLQLSQQSFKWGRKKRLFLLLTYHYQLFLHFQPVKLAPCSLLTVPAVFSCPCRPRGRRRLQGAGAQLPPVLPLPLHAGSAPGAAVLAAGWPRCAGAGRHRGGGRQHPHPLLPGHLWAPGAAEQQEHLRPVRWVGFVVFGFFWGGVGVCWGSCDWSHSVTSDVQFAIFAIFFPFFFFFGKFWFCWHDPGFHTYDTILWKILILNMIFNTTQTKEIFMHLGPQIGHIQNKRLVIAIERKAVELYWGFAACSVLSASRSLLICVLFVPILTPANHLWCLRGQTSASR